MEKVNKDNAMLLDVQYLKANRKNKQSDVLYLIWKNLDTNEKHLQVIPEPMMEIYFEKPEFRNHSYSKKYERKENLTKRVVKYKDIIYAIAEDMGEAGRNKLQQCFNTGNFGALKEFYIYPYVYGADFDIRTWYRHQWIKTFDNNRPKTIHKAFGDIEVDSLETPGFPNPMFNPVDLVTIIDGETKQAYTFCLLGVDCVEKDMSLMNERQKKDEIKRREMYAHRMETQKKYGNEEYLREQAHQMFDEDYPGFEYNFYFYKDEAKMLVHLFQLINKIKPDFLLFWNISFDIPFLMDRMKVLGLNPEDVICPKDFPIKQCWFKKDTRNFEPKNKSDFFHCTSYTIYADQMINYAATRKGQTELRSYKLQSVAEHVIDDKKLDYSENGNIKTVSYNNWVQYVLYNIKDVLLQYGIESNTSDLEAYYVASYKNATPYEDVFKQTKKLRNVEYLSYDKQGLVPGENVNGFLANYQDDVEEEIDDDEEEEDTGTSKKTTFEGALVGNPKLINPFGVEIFGRRSNSVFAWSIDFDMSAFYPNTIIATNLDCSTLIFKAIIRGDQYDVRGGDIPFHGITASQMVEENKDSFLAGDVAKELIDNFQTKNIITFAHKWMNAPSLSDIYSRLKDELG